MSINQKLARYGLPALVFAGSVAQMPEIKAAVSSLVAGLPAHTQPLVTAAIAVILAAVTAASRMKP